MKINQSNSFLLPFVEQVRTGTIVPASMQRPYVWTKADVEALCDSILSGFPIGGFLAWTPGKHADLTKIARNRLGPIVLKSDICANATSLLLDGQNRIVTLAWMMQQGHVQIEDPSPWEEGTWMGDQCLVLDWATRSVIFVPKSESEEGLRVPAWTLLTHTSSPGVKTGNAKIRELWLSSWAGSVSESEYDEFFAFWDLCCDMFRQARITLTSIENATVEEAKHAFVRICKVGVPMTEDDFAKAIAWNA